MNVKMRSNTETMKLIIGGDSQQIAYHLSRSRQRVEREYNADFPNVLDNIENWSASFALTNWSKILIFENWFEMMIRALRRKVKGETVSFPIQKERELLFIRNMINDLLAI